jgi:hypothetical protein
MGFGKFLKRALKPPKALRKLKVGKALLKGAVGFVVAGPGGAAAGVAGELKSSVDARAAERAQKAEQAAYDAAQAAIIPVDTVSAAPAGILDPGTTVARPAGGTTALAALGGSLQTNPMLLLVGGGVLVLLVILAARRGR